MATRRRLRDNRQAIVHVISVSSELREYLRQHSRYPTEPNEEVLRRLLDLPEREFIPSPPPFTRS